MLDELQIKTAAKALFEAERSCQQIQLLSLQYPDMTMDDAYRVQDYYVKLKQEAGRSIIGWKIGLTSKAMQYALNINIPDSGILFDDMIFENGSTIPADRFIQPRVEAEIAFLMKAPLKGPRITSFDVLRATEYIIPALEILDTRILRSDKATGKTRSVIDTIADNAANGGIVTGGRAMKPEDVDMRWMGAIVSRNGEVEETGLGAGVLNDPACGVAWLANRISKYGGQIEAGQIILAGSFIRPIETTHGSTITADYGPYGSVSAYFA